MLELTAVRTWDERRADDGTHQCRWCNPDLYPPLPAGCTTCDMCGTLLYDGRLHETDTDPGILCRRCTRLILEERGTP